MKERFCKALLSDVFNQSTVLEYGYSFDWRRVFTRIQMVIRNAPFNEVLDVLWYINDWIEKAIIHIPLILAKSLISFLKQNMSDIGLWMGKLLP